MIKNIESLEKSKVPYLNPISATTPNTDSGEESSVKDEINESPVDRKRRKADMLLITRFMIRKFLNGIYKKYKPILKNKENNFKFNVQLVSEFMENLMVRIKSTKVQFKRMCIIMVKFLECCLTETNYFQFLRNDIKKLIITSFILSIPNESSKNKSYKTPSSFSSISQKRDEDYKFYSQITGLTVSEINNCCSIVRPILIRESRLQYRFIKDKFRHQQQLQNDRLNYSNNFASIARDRLLNSNDNELKLTDLIDIIQNEENQNNESDIDTINEEERIIEELKNKNPGRNDNHGLVSLTSVFKLNHSKNRPKVNRKENKRNHEILTLPYENYSLNDLSVKIDDRETFINSTSLFNSQQGSSNDTRNVLINPSMLHRHHQHNHNHSSHSLTMDPKSLHDTSTVDATTLLQEQQIIHEAAEYNSDCASNDQDCNDSDIDINFNTEHIILQTELAQFNELGRALFEDTFPIDC
ncbi:hypothetical protein TBLA_0A00360 [Henningerozyma blattae CBS 6284]|uniref:Uncharacterized protein n=1 Tax=Henningerozyma blattae (strain ATCC 34711 / CBS 6284 / DSM 70876 / NBRC 10599 / NRRL Y-10934 / UCD 77-7) TaxID=1071380 RepID=I2GUN4_HENB6|nr:hypothetical protein TBLA_0A00360 [Tetrapisispora blattae CBS 6284]CCH57836.1 hypothetical protein TBLA_0A00360 [Tetrapisispora blattae CBS 6284]